MLRTSTRVTKMLGFVALLTLGAVVSASPDIDWYTVDSGGEMFCTGGQYVLSGTIGQPDAGVEMLTGGGYKLAGGFWLPASPTGGIVPPEDTNRIEAGTLEPAEAEPRP
jgi:hypothetical protein